MLANCDMGIPCGSFFVMLNFKACKLGPKRPQLTAEAID